MLSMPSVGSRTILESRALPAALFFFAFLGLLCVFGALASAGGPPEYVSGDFVIGAGQTLVLENRTLVISGNVSVASGGTLELRNSSLLLNLASNGTRTLTVEGGAVLRVLDLDGTPQTLFDRSEIGAADPPLRYLARFMPGSMVTVANSVLSGFGYSLASPGLLIESDAVSFSGATLQAFVYLRVEHASPQFSGTSFVADGLGSSYFFGSSSVIVNCTFDRNFVGLSASEGSNLTVSGALIRDSSFALAANGSRVAFSGSTVNNSSSGLFL